MLHHQTSQKSQPQPTNMSVNPRVSTADEVEFKEHSEIRPVRYQKSFYYKFRAIAGNHFNFCHKSLKVSYLLLYAQQLQTSSR